MLTIESMNKIVYGDQVFHLRRSIYVAVQLLDGVWSHTCSNPDLHGYGLTLQESLDMFCADFALCWNEIACEDDMNLTPAAKRLKQTMKRLVT